MLTDSRERTGWGEPAPAAPAANDRLRLLGAAAVAGIAAFWAMAGLWLTGVAGSVGGWAWSALAVGGAALAAGWVTWGPRRGRLAVVVALASAGVAVGTWLAATVPMGHGRLWSAMDEVFPQAAVSGTDSEGGNAICFDECPAIWRSWVVAGSREEVRAAVAEELQGAGYELGSWGPPRGGADGTALRAHRGRVHVVVRVEEEELLLEGITQEPPGGAEVSASMRSR